MQVIDAEDISSGGGARRGRARRYSRWGIALRVVPSVLVVAIVVSAFITIPDYAITPGSAFAVSSLISVPSGKSHAHDGSVSLTDVQLVPLRAIDYLFYRWNGDDEIEPNAAILGTASAAQYQEQGVLDMDSARQAATVVALQMLGYPTSAVADGVAIYGVLPGGHAPAHLGVGQVITAVDGHAALSISAIASMLDNSRPGTPTTLTVHPAGSAHSATVRIALGEAYSDSAGAYACLAVGTKTKLSPLKGGGHVLGCLPFEPDQLYATKGAPFSVSIDADGIVGPSAGLAFTLGLLEKLDTADLTGGRKIAATGTMSIDGSVGDVGGVAQKTVAVRNAGATVFFVPPQEYKVALAHAGSSLHVYAVTSARQAVADLEKLGGRLVGAKRQ